MATSGIPWPTSLPACAETYTEKAEPVTVRTNVEEGPPKVRRRFTVRILRAQVGMQMTIAQRNILDSFFYVELNGGVGRFTFTHPWTQQVVDWRFVEAPDFANNGPLGVSVTMVWEMMPI
jgi:hypothetical protein